MEELDTKKKYKLKHFINYLKSIRGRHTELVSVYVPQGTELIKTIQQLEQEQGTASNVKVLSNMTSGVPGKYKTGGQCLSPDTLVEINKSQTKIKNIKKGDLLKSYDSKNRKFIFSECVDVWKVKKSKVYKITTKNGFTNECSKDHIFFITNNKEKPAETLTTDDYLLTYENSEIISTKIL